MDSDARFEPLATSPDLVAAKQTEARVGLLSLGLQLPVLGITVWIASVLWPPRIVVPAAVLAGIILLRSAYRAVTSLREFRAANRRLRGEVIALFGSADTPENIGPQEDGEAEDRDG